MLIDPGTEDASFVYSTMIRAITPRPIAWVSTISEKGVTNLAPFSYFSGVCSRPAALMFSPVNRIDGEKKDTVRNIESTGQFVVNVVPYGAARSMLKTSLDFDFETSEFAEAGLTEKPSQRVVPPGVAQSPIQFECELLQIVPIGEGPLAANVIIGEIVLMNIDNAVLNENGKIDPELVDTIGRMGGIGYCRTTDRFVIEPSP